MKGVSELVSLVIIAAGIVAVSVTIFLYAYWNTQQANIVSEYSYTRSLLQFIQTSIEDILRGGVFERRYPGQNALFGSRAMSCVLTISLDFSNGTSENPPVKIENRVLRIGTRFPVVSSPRPMNMDRYRVIYDPKYFFEVYEYYENGWSYADLIPSGILVKRYVVNTTKGAINKTEIGLILLNTTHYGSAYIRARVEFDKNEVYTGVSHIVIADSCSGVVLEETGNITLAIYHLSVTT